MYGQTNHILCKNKSCVKLSILTNQGHHGKLPPTHKALLCSCIHAETKHRDNCTRIEKNLHVFTLEILFDLMHYDHGKQLRSYRDRFT